jgi:hypothetical protein
MKRLLILTIAIVCLVGCATKEMYNPVMHMPVAYQDGYLAGCDCGFVAAGHPFFSFKKDAYRYLADSLYKQGWDDGFNVCKTQHETARNDLRQ